MLDNPSWGGSKTLDGGREGGSRAEECGLPSVSLSSTLRWGRLGGEEPKTPPKARGMGPELAEPRPPNWGLLQSMGCGWGSKFSLQPSSYSPWDVGGGQNVSLQPTPVIL